MNQGGNGDGCKRVLQVLHIQLLELGLLVFR